MKKAWVKFTCRHCNKPSCRFVPYKTKKNVKVCLACNTPKAWSLRTRRLQYEWRKKYTPSHKERIKKFKDKWAIPAVEIKQALPLPVIEAIHEVLTS